MCVYSQWHVFGAGHLRRPPLLSVFDINYTKSNIIDKGVGGWGGVGWDNSVICCTFSCTCTHTSCYAAVRSHALAHIRHATLLYVLMHLHTYVMLRCCTFSCTCTHTSCYAAVRSHALAHIRHATPLYVLMHLHTYVMLRRCTFSCTCTHTSCYAAVRSHALAHIVMLRRCTFSCTCTHTSCYAAVRSHALAHIRHATLLYVLMHLHTYVMLRCCTFSCTCTHTSCYAAVRFHALAHIRHATPLYVLMHFQIVGRVLGGWLWICKWWWWWWYMMMMMMMMMMMKLLLMVKFRFSAFCVPPVKCLKSDNSGGPLRCPAPCFCHEHGPMIHFLDFQNQF